MAKRSKNTDELPKAKLTVTSLKRSLRLFDHVGKHKWQFFLGLLFLIFTGITALVFPRLMGSLVDANKISIEEINEKGIWLLLLFMAQAISSYFRVVLFVNVTENMLASIRQTTYSHLVKLPMTYFAKHRVGEINSRMASDITQIGDTFTTNIAEFLRQLIIIIGGLVALFITSLKLALAMLAVIPLVAIIAVIFGRYIRKLSRQVQDQVANSNTILEETMQGISNVKAFANELFEITRYTKSVQQIKELAIKGGKARGAFFSFIIFCLFGSIVMLIWYSVRLENAGEISHGTMIQFMLYTIFVGASIGGIAEQYAQIQKTIGATERVFEIIDEPTENLKLNTHHHPNNERISGKVTFDKLAFSYPTRHEITVLKDVSFEVKKGETIAIVGPSGSGKSTLIALLMRFYNINSGKITIDDKNIYDFELHHLRNNMALVPQDVLLFGGSIKENILYGKPTAGMNEIIDAAKKANAHDFIMSFPEQYDTIVGERGVKLSGGQRQRIAIARAVLKDPSILLLDEATSSLDSESERLVQEALDKLMIGRTSFVVAHRLSTIRNADKIIVIDKGTVVQQGTHQQLIEQEGLYKQLSKVQFETEGIS